MNIDRLIENGYLAGRIKPKDRQVVAYLFEPFMSFHVGIYDKENDMVEGGSGFTSWQPEVLVWYPLPGIE